jgi:hypothetical protein
MEPFSDETIRERAYHIWEREGRPDGRADEHWYMARSELAIEFPPPDATAETPTASSQDINPHPEPVEPLEAVENQGAFPSLTDQDDDQLYPERKLRRTS